MKKIRCFTLLSLVAIISFPCPIEPSFADWPNNEDLSWPEFRGPLGNGHAEAENLPIEFGEDKNLSWKAALPGRGWSSPVVVSNQIWLTTAVETKATEAEREKKLATARSMGLSAYSKVVLQAICVDLASGEIVQQIDLFEVEDPPLIHSLNSFASPTPVCDESRVYCHFGTFGTACIERSSGEVIWKTQKFQLDHETGPGSSPIIWNDTLIFNCDGCDQQYVVAVDKEDGQEVWRTDRTGELADNPQMKKAFSTPVVVDRDGNKELISAGANWIYGYDPKNGKELWRLSYGQLGFSNVARPVVNKNMLYVCSCFMQSKLMAIDISGSGAVTDDDVKWTFNQRVPNMPSPILVDGGMYFVNDRGIASMVDVETGDEVWAGRLGGEFSSSPIFADGHLFFGNRDGQLFVVLPGKELKVVATNELDAAIMASPAAFGETILVRTAESLYRFDKE